MKKSIAIVILLFVGSSLFAQGEYNNWVMGDSLWVDFNSGSPVQGTKPYIGPIGTTISDKNGNLLFYIDQISASPPYTGQVRNVNGGLMPNGDSIINAYNTFQGFNILPFPCNDSLYYLFSYNLIVIPGSAYYELYYSIINMNLNNGLGDVIVKNVLFDSMLSSGFAMTRHSNNRDYWINYQLADTNIHVSRHFSSTGFGPPIYSTLGINRSTNLSNNRSGRKFSPDGQKLISCHNLFNAIEVFDFDNNTGILSNQYELNLPAFLTPYDSTYVGPYTSQFSPDMSKLYITGGLILIQYDFSSGIQNTIKNSAFTLKQTTSAYDIVDITLAPDNIIYITTINTRFSVINSPNSLGTSCNFVDYGLLTSVNTGVGFPTMLPNLFVHRDVLSDSLLCQYDTINLYLSDTNFIDSLVWNFGDTASGVLNTSTDIVPLHVYNEYGIYPIEVIIYSGCVNDTIHDTIRINPTPIANLGPDTILCEGDSMQLLFNDTSFNYLWSTGDTTMSIQILHSDTFSVAISSICGVDYDTIVIDSLIPALVHLPNDTLLCSGDSLLLDATIQSGTYVWNVPTLDSVFWVSDSGTYSVTATNFCGTDSDTIIVSYTHPPHFDFGNDTSLCVGDTLVLNAWDTLSSFLWSSGDTFALDTATLSGIYSATTTNLCGTHSDTIQVWFLSAPSAQLGNDTVLCAGDILNLSDTTLFGSYAWNTGATSDTLSVSLPGIYQLTVTNVCGVASDTIEVWYDNSPITNLGPDSTYCLSSLVNLDAYWSRATYLWNTSDTTHDITANYSGQYSVMVTNLCGFDDDTVMISYDIPINFNLGPDTLLCQGDSILLAAPAHNATWLWNNGNVDSTLMVYTLGTYSVTARNHCGSFSADITVTSENVPILSSSVPDTSFCEGLSYEVSIDKNNADQIIWSDGVSSFVRTLNQTGNYIYTLQNICGTTSDSFQLNVEFPTAFSLGNDTVLCYGEEITKSFDFPNHTYLWNDGSTENQLTFTQSGVYGLTIYTPAHCESYDEFEVSECDAQLFVPNAFTPGGSDDLNSTFQVKGVGIKAYRIVIYDRWGQQVFESSDINNSWDGTFNGENSPMGVYSYKIWYNPSGDGHGTGDSPRSIEKMGSVTVVR